MKTQHGVTLPEVMIAVTIIGILAGVALPSYQGYLQRSMLSEAFDALSAYQLRMDQAFHNNGNFGTDACAVTVPAASENFSFACELADDAQSYLVRATGSGRMSGFTFTVDDRGARTTEAFPNQDALPAGCWLTKAGDCR
jgi:type IV pilus assembly protein PilE